jgi:hypothetical protein
MRLGGYSKHTSNLILKIRSGSETGESDFSIELVSLIQSLAYSKPTDLFGNVSGCCWTKIYIV